MPSVREFFRRLIVPIVKIEERLDPIDDLALRYLEGALSEEEVSILDDQLAREVILRHEFAMIFLSEEQLRELVPSNRIARTRFLTTKMLTILTFTALESFVLGHFRVPFFCLAAGKPRFSAKFTPLRSMPVRLLLLKARTQP